MFVKLFQKPGESLQKWTMIFSGICDAVNVLVSVLILIIATIQNGIIGFFVGLIVSAIFFFCFY